jgi:ribose transport system permease protein
MAVVKNEAADVVPAEPAPPTDERAAAPAASDVNAAPGRANRRDLAGRFAYRWGLLVVWALVIVVFGVLKPDTFLTQSNFSTIFGSQAVLVILAVALLIPLTTGEYDLSVAGSLGMGLILTQWLQAEHGWSLGTAITAALLSGVIVGAVNAFFIIKIGVESLIMTLGMGTLLTGIGFALTETTVVSPSTGLSDAVRNHFFGIPLAFYYGLALTVAAWYVYARTPLGRYLYFVGSGRDVARLSGIKVDALRAGGLIVAGLISAFAGVVLAGVLGSSSPSVSGGFLLPAFAAVFLGATAVTPGRFNPWGTFIAVYFLITGITGLELLGLVGWIEQVFYGAALIIAVALSRLAAGRAAVST